MRDSISLLFNGCMSFEVDGCRRVRHTEGVWRGRLGGTNKKRGVNRCEWQTKCALCGLYCRPGGDESTQSKESTSLVTGWSLFQTHGSSEGLLYSAK